MDRKAQSQIITTVLLILIVLAAVIIVWQVIRNFVEPSTGPQDDCFRVQLSFENVQCNNGTATGNVKRGADDLGSVDMKYVVGDGTTERAAVTAPGALGTSSFTLTGADVVDGAAVVVSAMVDQNSDYLCSPSDEIILRCS